MDTQVIGSMVFEDASETDLSGESSTQDRVAFGGGTNNLGNITLDLVSGEAVVDVATIQREADVTEDADIATSAHDFSGSYQITSSGLTLPEGYAGVCAASERDNPDSRCFGPTEGEPIFIKMINGVKDGTSEPAHGMMIWESETIYNTCGAKLGFTYAQGKAHGVDFTNSGVEEGSFNWKTGFEQGWKDTANARTQWDQIKMERAEIGGYPGMKQYFKQYTSNQDGSPVETPGYQFNADSKESGCRTADGRPAEVYDWPENTQCTDTAVGDTGLRKSVCTFTTTLDSGEEEVTCTHINGTFTTDNTPITDGHPEWPNDFEILLSGPSCESGEPMWSPEGMQCSDGSTPSQGQLCSEADTSTAQGQLAQLRCYLDHLHQNFDSLEGGVTECVRDVRGNWNARTPEEFIAKADGPESPMGQHVFELFKYDDANSGRLRGKEVFYEGVKVGDNWTDCKVAESFSLAVRKYDDSDDLLAEMISSMKLLDEKPACVAQFGEETGQMKMMFKLEKQ